MLIAINRTPGIDFETSERLDLAVGVVRESVRLVVRCGGCDNSRMPMSFFRGLTCLSLTAAWVASTAAPEVNLDPAAWPPGELELYGEQEHGWGRDKAPAKGRAGMVAGTTGPLAIRAGVEALRQGGSAMDAAITTSLAQITLVAGATVSFAGRMTLVYYDAETGEVTYLNGNWDVPRAEDGIGIPRCGRPHGRQALVPGYMAAIEAANDRHGELPFDELFRPAIYFAREGVEVNEVLAAWIGFRYELIAASPDARAILLRPDGGQYAVGESLRQPVLARTLERVAKRGARYMYSRGWAKKYVRRLQALGGRITVADMRAYEPTWHEPTSFEFDGVTVNGPSMAGAGGAHLQGALGALKPGALRRAGHYTDSADALAKMLEATEHRYDALRMEGSHSDGVVAVDRAGNVAALLHTINTDLWGGLGMFVDGVSVADVGCWAQAGIERAGPGGRLVSPDNPLIVTRDGVAIAASSAIGSGLYPTTMFSLVNQLAYGMTAAEVVGTPTFHQARFVDGERVTHRVTRGEFSPQLLAEMRARGYQVEEYEPGHGHLGFWVGLTTDEATGRRTAAAGKALNGIALAE